MSKIPDSFSFSIKAETSHRMALFPYEDGMDIRVYETEEADNSTEVIIDLSREEWLFIRKITDEHFEVVDND